jgi:endopeptidase La
MKQMVKIFNDNVHQIHEKYSLDPKNQTPSSKDGEDLTQNEYATKDEIISYLSILNFIDSDKNPQTSSTASDDKNNKSNDKPNDNSYSELTQTTTNNITNDDKDKSGSHVSSQNVNKYYTHTVLTEAQNVNKYYTHTVLTEAHDVEVFDEIKNQLLELMRNYGANSLKMILEMLVGSSSNIIYEKSTECDFILDESIINVFNIYNKTYIITSVDISNDFDPSDDFHQKDYINVKKIPTKYETMIENNVSIELFVKRLGKTIKSEGYICSDTLNILLRTSQICTNDLYNKKNTILTEIYKARPLIDSTFVSKYTKHIRVCNYLIYSVDQFVERFILDYQYFTHLTSKQLNPLIRDFAKQNQNLEGMYNIIFLLLLGSEQNQNFAFVLYDSTRENKTNGDFTSNIIYNNLTFALQKKLSKVTISVKNEISRIKKIAPEEIDIKKKIATMVNMPDNVKAYILEKNKEKNSNGDNNYKAQMAIDALLSYPWNPIDADKEFKDLKKSLSKSRDYLRNIAKSLDETVFGHNNSKKILIELVGKWIQNPQNGGYVIGLHGPPGVGKTLLAKGIGNALGIPMVTIPLGGMNDAGDLAGHNYTYIGSQYGMVVRQMIKAGKHKCVMLFDEIDKTSSRYGTNEISNILVHITDPNMNKHFQDRFFSSSIEFDLSNVLMIFSYNDSSQIDPILMDRIFEINVESYSEEEKIKIGSDYILKELCDNINLQREFINICDNEIKYIINNYTVEAGVRELKRKMEQILLKLNIDRIYMKGPFTQIMKDYLEEQKERLLLKTYEIDEEEESMKKLSKKKKKQEKLSNDTTNEISGSGTDISSAKDTLKDTLKDDTLKDTLKDDTLKDTLKDDTLKDSANQITEKDSIDDAYLEKENFSSVKKYVDYVPSEYESQIDDAILNDIFNLKHKKVTISRSLIHHYLDKPVIQSEKIHNKNMTGVINGLYATSIGLGGIVSIQVRPNNIKESNNYLQITGNQKKVMEESVKYAFNTIMTLINDTHRANLSVSFVNGFHIHAPDGGTPKDGPSAGCAFATAIFSAIINKPVNREIAMTGEIEMTGKISKIGGLLYKLRGAKNAGVKTVYICEENRSDYNSIKKKFDELFTDGFQVKIISHIIDLISDPNIIIGVTQDDFDHQMLEYYGKL